MLLLAIFRSIGWSEGDPFNQPLEKTILPVFRDWKAGPGEATLPAAFSNYRLVLHYSSTPEARATVTMAGRPACLPPGQNQTAELAVEQFGDGPFVIRSWRSGRPKPDSWESPLPEKREPATRFGAVPGHPSPATLKAGAGFTLHRAYVQPLALADHQLLTEEPEKRAINKGRPVYEQSCLACHGTVQAEGSLPTSRKFHRDAFKVGADVYSIWRVIRYGHGQMPAQSSLSTAQAYAVARFVQATMIRPYQPERLPPEDEAWRELLPRGMTTTAEPQTAAPPPPWELMDFGPYMFQILQVDRRSDGKPDLVGKALSIRLDPGPGGVTRGQAWAVYDLDTLRLAAFAEGGKLHNFRQICLDGTHGTHPVLSAEKRLIGPPGPGWARPGAADWEDPRPRSLDGEPYGPMPRDWLRYRGLHIHGQSIAIAYTVGSTEILESPAWEGNGRFTRHFHLGKSEQPLRLRTGPDSSLLINPSQTPGVLAVTWDAAGTGVTTRWNESTDPANFTLPGPPRFPAVHQTKIVSGKTDGPFVVERLQHPASASQPGASWMRFTGMDIFPDGDSAALCTWNGDVWIVRGLASKDKTLRWNRHATGLSMPLGLKIIKGVIHVGCLDQIVRLGDPNKDGEADFLECVNSDHQVTGHFHEFAMDLQTDAEGNFLYAKGARHGKPATVPQHGTLLRVKKDGSSTEILAGGFRAPNGVCPTPEGQFLLTDQEGNWVPKNPIHFVQGLGPAEYFGNAWAYGAPPEPSSPLPPLCWLTNDFDRSPSQIVWVPTKSKWSGLQDRPLILSYGTGTVSSLINTSSPGTQPGLVWKLPIDPFPTGLLRGRFYNKDLYLCGMVGWASNQPEEGGFFRLRPTGQAYLRPLEFSATKDTLFLRFSHPLDPLSAVSPKSYQIKSWHLRRTEDYGSPHVDEKSLPVHRAALRGDGVLLRVPELDPGASGSLVCRLQDTKGQIHHLDMAFTLPLEFPEPTAEEERFIAENPLLSPDDPVPDPPPGLERLPELDDPPQEEDEPLPRK